MLTLLFYRKDQPIDEQRPKEMRFRYFDPLTVAIDKFNDLFVDSEREGSAPEISKLYNRYGQEIPLNYRVQRTNLELFY